jgi:hypothetical protein
VWVRCWPKRRAAPRRAKPRALEHQRTKGQKADRLDARGLLDPLDNYLAAFDSAGRRDWLATTSIGRATAPDLKALASRLRIAPDFAAQVRAAIAPGSTLIVTDMPVSRQTRSGAGFGILTADATL